MCTISFLVIFAVIISEERTDLQAYIAGYLVHTKLLQTVGNNTSFIRHR